MSEPQSHERIVVFRTHPHWSAHFADRPDSVFGGHWPPEAITRLLHAPPKRAMDRSLAAI